MPRSFSVSSPSGTSASAAAAGAIIVSTERPIYETNATAFLSAAEDDTYLFKGSFGAGLGDSVAWRVSADFRESDGYYRNQFQGGAPIVDSYESWNVNARVLWEPTDRTTVDTKLRLGEVSANSITRRSMPIPSPAAGGMPCSSARI